MSLPTFLPWHTDVARHWLAADQRQRLAHAWLIHGLAGIGKVEFARAAAASLLCESPVDGMACGQCPACIWYGSGNHPDFRRIRPEAVALVEGQAEDTVEEGAEDEVVESDGKRSKRAPSREIKVEQIRSMETWVNTGTHRGGLRVVVLYPADTLNTIAANALLKVLEEPPPHTVFLLVSDAPDRLLPTLISRCRRLPLAAPPAEEALAWLTGKDVADAAGQLAAAGGAPVAALRRAEAGESARPDWIDGLVKTVAAGKAPDIGGLVDVLEKIPATEWIDTLQRLCVDVSLMQAGLAARYFPALREPLAGAAKRAGRRQVADTGRWLATQQRIASHPLNAKLFVQDALTRVCGALLPRKS